MRKRDNEDLIEFLQWVIRKCEGCGSKEIVILNASAIEKENRSFFESIADGMTGYKKDEREGIEIEYACSKCNNEFVRFCSLDYILACTKLYTR